MLKILEKRRERAAIAAELKLNAKIAGTFPRFGSGEEETAAYVIEKRGSLGYERGLMFRVTKGGERQPVISAHEEWEPINAGSYEHQRELAIQYARQEGVGYGEVDQIFIGHIMAERRRV